MKTWECKIGEVDAAFLPEGADFPMRRAIETAYHDLTGEWRRFIFSDWGAELDTIQREIVESTSPDAEVVIFEDWRLPLKTETAQQQIDRLARFIMDEVPGEPSQSQGAVDTAIRIIRATLSLRASW